MSRRRPIPPIPRGFVELCDSEEAVAIMIASRAGKRLRHVAESGAWLIFVAPGGWMPVSTAVVEETLTDCARANIGTVDKATKQVKFRPTTTGRRHVGRAVAGLLTGRVEVASQSADWDAAPNVIMLPDGTLLDLFTGERRPSSVGELIRRRVPVDPAADTEFDRSRFRAVLKHAVPDPTEREYLQRRLGAALADREGMDDLLWLYGPPGSAKGTLAAVLKRTFGDYAGGVPINQLTRGTNRSGHSAWAARLAGCRLMFADDVPVGHYLDDSTVNMLLGSEITAQHMRCAYFDFRLNAPIFATSNAPPQTTSMNVRRLKPIPSGPRVTAPDPAVRAAMSSPPEVAACLRWLIDGARLWRESGCTVPATCIARAEEAADQAPVAEFTETFDPGARYSRTELYQRWGDFKHGLGEKPGAQRTLWGLLRSVGWIDCKSHGTRQFQAPRQARGTLGVTSLIDSHVRAGAHMRVNNESDPKCPPPADDDMPPGALDCYANGGEQGRPPPDGPAESAEAPPPRPARRTASGRQGSGERRDRERRSSAGPHRPDRRNPRRGRKAVRRRRHEGRRGDADPRAGRQGSLPSLRRTAPPGVDRPPGKLDAVRRVCGDPSQDARDHARRAVRPRRSARRRKVD